MHRAHSSISHRNLWIQRRTRHSLSAIPAPDNEIDSGRVCTERRTGSGGYHKSLNKIQYCQHNFHNCLLTFVCGAGAGTGTGPQSKYVYCILKNSLRSCRGFAAVLCCDETPAQVYFHCVWFTRGKRLSRTRPVIFLSSGVGWQRYNFHRRQRQVVRGWKGGGWGRSCHWIGMWRRWHCRQMRDSISAVVFELVLCPTDQVHRSKP